MKEIEKEIREHITKTQTEYNITVAYVANCLKQYGEKGLPVVWDDDNYVADAIYDDCECVRYEIDAIRTTKNFLSKQVLEVHVVTNNYDECDEWIEVSEFDMDTTFGIISHIQF